MALFVLASKDGWVNLMYTGLDAVGVDQQVQLTKMIEELFQYHVLTFCLKAALTIFFG